jgi:hypothetical protein
MLMESRRVTQSADTAVNFKCNLCAKSIPSATSVINIFYIKLEADLNEGTIHLLLYIFYCFFNLCNIPPTHY